MAEISFENPRFYEQFWQDQAYQLGYALDSAVRDRYPAIVKVWDGRKLPETVLDFGCGNGVLTAVLYKEGFGNEILGVDVSMTAIENAQTRYMHDGLQFERIDSGDLPGHKYFDVIIASHVLEHIDEPENVLSLLKSRAGYLVLEVPLERCWWQDLVYRLFPSIRRDNPVGHVNFWSKESFRQCVNEAGLEILNDYHYASAPFSPYTHWLKRICERCLLAVLGLKRYSRLMATHYSVLAGNARTNTQGE